MEVNLRRFPNPGIEAAMTSKVMREILEDRIIMARELYLSQVARRTGALARSVHTSVEIQPVIKGERRYVAELTVGGLGVEYGAAHEFGRSHEVEGPQPATVADPNARVVTSGHYAAHDLNRVLEQLAAY